MTIAVLLASGIVCFALTIGIFMIITAIFESYKKPLRITIGVVGIILVVFSIVCICGVWYGEVYYQYEEEDTLDLINLKSCSGYFVGYRQVGDDTFEQIVFPASYSQIIVDENCTPHAIRFKETEIRKIFGTFDVEINNMGVKNKIYTPSYPILPSP